MATLCEVKHNKCGEEKMEVSVKIETMLSVHASAEGSTGDRQLELVTNKHIP